jgi:hypothetical protein
MQYLKYSNRSCYICHKKGHIATQCKDVCKKCLVPHKERICIGDLANLVTELNYVKLEKSKEFQRALKRESPVEIASRIKVFEQDLQALNQHIQYRQKVKQIRRDLKKTIKTTGLSKNEKSEIYRAIPKQAEQLALAEPIKPDVNPSDPFVRKLINDLTDIKNFKTIAEEYMKMNQYMKKKFEEVKQQADTYTSARKKQLEQEHKEFLEAKRLGVKAVLSYKMNKNKARERERLLAQDVKFFQKQLKEEQQKLYKMSLNMNYYKPKTEQQKLTVGSQNYLHTSRIIKQLDFCRAKLVLIRDKLKTKQFNTANNIWDSLDLIGSLRHIIDTTEIEGLFMHGPDHTSYYILGITNTIAKIDQQINWYKSNQKRAIDQIYDAHV